MDFDAEAGHTKPMRVACNEGFVIGIDWDSNWPGDDEDAPSATRGLLHFSADVLFDADNPALDGEDPEEIRAHFARFLVCAGATEVQASSVRRARARWTTGDVRE